MLKNGQKKKAELSKPVEIFKVELKYLLMYLIGFILSSVIILLFDLKLELYYAVSLGIFMLCSLLCGTLCGIKKRNNGLMNAVIHTLPVNLILLVISMLMNGISIDLNIAISFVLLTVSSAIGGILGVNTKLKK